MIITHAELDQLDAIMNLERDSFPHQENWSDQAWSQELSSDEACVMVSNDADGTILGVAAFRCVADMADLNRIIVRPDARRQGVGARLILAGLDWAQASGADRMLLEVRTDNDAAVSLYRNLGFDEISQRRDYYGPGHDAWVMLRPIGDEDEEWAESPLELFGNCT